MIDKQLFADKMKLFSSLTAQRVSPEMISAFYERFKYSDEQIVLSSIEAMIHDDDKLTFGKLKEKVKHKVLASKEKHENEQINVENWPEIQRQRMKALTEAIQSGSEAVRTLKEYQDKGEGIWSFKNDEIDAKYACHANCDAGWIFYERDGYSYAGCCAICKRGPGKPAHLINPDNYQIIKQGYLRQG